jgi:hypothetical protein
MSDEGLKGTVRFIWNMVRDREARKRVLDKSISALSIKPKR